MDILIAAVILTVAVIGFFYALGCLPFEIFSIMVGGISFAYLFIFVPFGQVESRAQVQEFYAVKQTLERTRGASIEGEGNAAMLKVSEMNQWLAQAKYYNSIFDFTVTDEVDGLEPIQ